jgi:hypothetical protein
VVVLQFEADVNERKHFAIEADHVDAVQHGGTAKPAPRQVSVQARRGEGLGKVVLYQQGLGYLGTTG